MSSVIEPFSYRHDPAIPRFPDDQPIIVYDGNCRLCSAWVRFVLRRDRHDRFRFIAAQSLMGTALYRHYGLDPDRLATNILLDQGLPWFKSEGTIRMLERLGFPWSLVGVGRVLPLRWRDGIYDAIAQNRLRWLGGRVSCFLQDPRQAHKFLG